MHVQQLKYMYMNLRIKIHNKLYFLMVDSTLHQKAGPISMDPLVFYITYHFYFLPVRRSL